jgi:S-adenosylhomocysteine hydrolase
LDLGLSAESSHFFYKDYPYSHRNAVEQWLRNKGIDVRSVSELESFISDLSSNPEKVGRLLIIEDGGFSAPLLHGNYTALLPFIIGVVEQTTNGIRNDQAVLKNKNELLIPIASVAESEIKNRIEPVHVARAVIQNIKSSIPDTNLAGRNVTIIGFGAIGESLSHELKANDAIVTVFDSNENRRLSANQKGFLTAQTSAEAVSDADIVIGCSGTRSITRDEIARMKHGCILVSASSELKEIAVEELEKLSKTSVNKPFRNPKRKKVGTIYIMRQKCKTIILLADGYPINFWGMNSMPDNVSDLVLSLILISAIEISKGRLKQNGINSDFVNKIADEYRISKLYLDSHGP